MADIDIEEIRENLTVQLAIHAEMMSRESYSDYGTFEGILETASIREGTNLTIRDQIYGPLNRSTR